MATIIEKSRSHSPDSPRRQPVAMGADDIKACIKELDHRLRDYPRMPSYEPADGCKTPARYKHYQACKSSQKRQRFFYSVQDRKLRLKGVTTKVGGESDLSDGEGREISGELHSIRSKYSKAMEDGFKKDPWNRNGTHEPRELWYQRSGSAARKGWNVENGFNKIYRELPAWKSMDFDEEDLAPEETAGHVVADVWLAAYNSRTRQSPVRRVCAGLRHGASSVAHAVDDWKHKHLRGQEQSSSEDNSDSESRISSSTVRPSPRETLWRHLKTSEDITTISNTVKLSTYRCPSA